MALRELALFAGAGGGILGGLLSGWHTVCAVECDAYAASVLAQRQSVIIEPQHFAPECGDWWAAEPGMVRVLHGLAHRVDRIKALGNGQVPIVAARAWERMAS